MKYTQNVKIMQISEETLIIGVDVASLEHYARAFDYRGIELDRVFRFKNDQKGFNSLVDWIESLSRKHGKSHVLVGMEPTGHYWYTLAQHLKDHQIKLVLVNPFHVKRSKELDDNNPTKNDRKDPKTIAMLVKDGRYMEPYLPEGIYSELRIANNNRRRMVKQLNIIRNQVKRWISIYFPEFDEVFANWEGKAALIILKEYPTPDLVLKKGIDGITSRWREEINRGIGQNRAVRLVKAAQGSSGVKLGLRSAQDELSGLLEQYELLQRRYQGTMALIEELVAEIPGFAEVMKIKGMGLITASGFIAEVGDISRFEHPRQIQKLAGLNLKENSSGKYKGKTTITKRGRKYLRSVLFQGIMPMVAKNPEFKELHRYYTTRKQNPLKKLQSIILLCCKLIRVIYAILKKGIVYSPEKMMADIKRQPLLGTA